MYRRLRPLAFVALLVLVTACAAGAARSTAPDVAIARPPASGAAAAVPGPAGRFVVRPEGARGPLVAYTMPAGTVQFHLPAGVLSADGTRFYAAAAAGGQTVVSAYDPAAGARTGEASLAGDWDLSGVSASGRWLALTRATSEQERQIRAAGGPWTTTVQVLDMQNGGGSTHTAQLDGNFEVDGLSTNGDALFLIQYLPALHPDHYLVRLYDLAAGSLQAGALVSKTADEIMVGKPLESVASPDGQWLLTLYLKTSDKTSFIHALNLANRFTVCIDLPAGDFDLLKDYTLALAPDGRRVYAANAAAGVVAAIDLESFQMSEAHFQGRALSSLLPGAGDPRARNAHSAVSADGRLVYFTGGQDLWVYDATGSGTVTGPHPVDGPVAGIGVSADGRLVYVAAAGRAPQAIDIATSPAEPAPDEPATPAAPVPTAVLPAGAAPALEPSALVSTWRQGLDGEQLYPLDLATGRPLEGRDALALGEDAARAFSPDGRRLAALAFAGNYCDAYMGGTRCRPAARALYLIDLQSWRALSVTLDTPGYVWPVTYSPDGRRLALFTQAKGTRRLELLDAATGQTLAGRELDFAPVLLGFSADGANLVAYGSPDSDGLARPGPPRLLLLDGATLDVLWEQTLAEVTSGFWCLSGCQDEHGKQLYAEWTPGVVLSPDGRTLYLLHADEDRLTIVDLAARTVRTVAVRPPQSLLDGLLALTAGVAEAKGGTDGAMRAAVLSPDGTRLYVTGYRLRGAQNADGFWDTQEEPAGLLVIDAGSGAEIARRDTSGQSLRISQDGAYLFLMRWDQPGPVTEVVDAQTLDTVARLDNWDVAALRQVGGRPVVLAARAGDLRSQLAVLDLASGETVKSWQVDGAAAWVVVPFLAGLP